MTGAADLCGTVPKNGREEIRVELSEFKGYQLVNFRVFAQHRETGELVPTKAGVTFRTDKLKAIIDVLETARRKAAERGWTVNE